MYSIISVLSVFIYFKNISVQPASITSRVVWLSPWAVVRKDLSSNVSPSLTNRMYLGNVTFFCTSIFLPKNRCNNMPMS